MKKVVILGHFAFNKDKANGQTIKTKIVAAELQRVLGHEEVGMEDTMGGIRFLLRLPFVLLRMLRHYQNIVFLPAYKGVRIIVPPLVLMNFLFRRKLHYVVIGGWLSGYVRKNPILRWALGRLNGIYVETQSMKQELEAIAHLHNLLVMPNCKPLNIVNESDFPTQTNPPYKLCTFSRVMKKKGIEDAILAVRHCNQDSGHVTYSLDIYGMVEPGEETWFEELMKGQPSYIKYGGIIPFSESTRVLKDYFAMLFPTHFYGEGFAGTIIDALSAGIPTFASENPSNRELIDEGKTGMLFPLGSAESLGKLLQDMADNPSKVEAMKVNCIAKAGEYLPEIVLKTLTERL